MFYCLDETPLYLATKSGNCEIIKILLNHNGINVNKISILIILFELRL